MATVINLNESQSHHDYKISEELKTLLEERKNAKREPLTAEKLRKTQGLENLSDQEALEAIETIQKLASIFFEIGCLNQPTCIDNQQVVHLNQQSKAA
jgi:hypothetical protein